MPTYKYTAKNLQSVLVSGKVDAPDVETLTKRLQQQNLFLITSRITKNKDEDSYKLKTVELAEFNRELGTMLSSGISLVRALNIITQGDLKPALRSVYKSIYTQIQQGVIFSEALENQTGSFPDLMIQMYRAGEASGSMEKIAHKLAFHYNKELKTQGKIKSATTYPIILLCLTVVIMLIIFTFVLPNFFDVFDSFDAELPGITKAIMGLSQALTQHFLPILIVTLIVIAIITTVVKMPTVKWYLDKLKLRLPKIGSLLKIVYTARFARTLSSMYTSGLSMLRALEVTTGTMGNTYIASQFTHVAGRVRNGAPLSSALQDVDGFDSKLVSTVYIGEESGRLDEMLDSIADSYDYESERATEKMITMIEPIMIIALAVIIGTVMLSVMVPIYTMYQSIG